MSVGVQCFLAFIALLSSAASGQGPAEPGQQTGSYLRDQNNVQNKEHIREHMSDYYKDGDMEGQLDLESEETTRFHYFKLHDYDNNNKLDGLELYAAIAHYSDHSHDGVVEDQEQPSSNTLEHKQVVRLVDVVLEQDDYNDDGFIDYFEFVRAQDNAEAEGKDEV